MKTVQVTFLGLVIVVLIGCVCAVSSQTTYQPAKTVLHGASVHRHVYKVTAYCPCPKCCGKYGWGYTTASGHKIKAGDRFVAAPKDIAFGTILGVPGYGVVPVLDRGGAIKGNRLDVYFPTHQEALNWGVKILEVSEVK